ncbi:MAG: restriction endonuclease subunit S [Dehalococcoidia bacterium]
MSLESRLPAVAWKKRRLDAVAQVRTGIAKGSKQAADPVELPYLRVANVQAGALDLEEIKTISVDRTQVGRYSLRPGDVLMTEGGDFDKLGRGTIWTGQIDPCLHQNHVFSVRCDQSKVIPEWISWVSSSHYGRRYFLLCSKQSTNLASINSSQLKAFPLPLPTLAQQKVIAEIIRSAESRVATVDRLIDQKRTFKRGLMQQLLTGQKRFPEFRDRPWKMSGLEDHVEPVTRKNASGATLVLTASGEHGLVDQRRYFNRNVAGADLSKYFLLRKGEFAYNRSAMNGYPYGATKRLDAHREGVLSTLYLCFSISDSKLDSDFLKHVFESGVLNRQLRPIVRVGARAHGLLNVTDDDFLSISIPYPQFDEQKRIAGVLNDLDRELDLLAAQREQVEMYKRSLLSRLLSGELRVPA